MARYKVRKRIACRFIPRQDAFGGHPQPTAEVSQHRVKVPARDLQRICRAFDGPYAVHVVQLEHALVERVGLTQIGKVQGHDLGAVGRVGAVGAHGLCAAAHLAQDVDVVWRGRIKAPRAAPRNPALTQVVKVAVFCRGCRLLIIGVARGWSREAHGFVVVLVLGVVHQIHLERMRRPTGAGW